MRERLIKAANHLASQIRADYPVARSAPRKPSASKVKAPVPVSKPSVTNAKASEPAIKSSALPVDVPEPSVKKRGRPPKTGGRLVTRSVQFDKEELLRIKSLSKSSGVSFAAFIRSAVSAYISNFSEQ
jgi:hypothetical protein